MGNAGSIITEAKSRGNTFFQSKKYRSAVQHYRHALATESGGAEAHLLFSNLAAVYTAAHFPASALAAADAATALKPDWPKGHFRRGTVLAACELWVEAARSFERALAAEPRNASVQRAIAAAREKVATAHGWGGGAAFTWGRGEFGALGHGDARDKTLPRVVDALRGRRLVDVACGTGHTLVLTEEGDCFGWGWNRDGQCGVASTAESVPTPTLLGALLGREVKGIACGAAHSVAVTAQGQVLS